MMETDNLIIRKPELRDFERFWGLLNDPITKRYMDDAGKLGYTERLKLFETQCKSEFSEDGAEFAVISKETKRYIGYCGFRRSKELNAPEFRFNYCRDSWGHGYGLEAGEAVIDYLLETYGHKQYYAFAYEDNIASTRVLDRLGFYLVKSGSPNLYKIDKEDRI